MKDSEDCSHRKTTDMNIIVRPNGNNSCYCRPDTTCERENRDYYVPDGIISLKWAPVVFVRVSKAGKCIGRKFASRYYDSFSFGSLLYGADNESSCQSAIAFTSCLDHTSVLPSQMYSTDEMDNGMYDVHKDGVRIFSLETTKEELAGMIEETICLCSQKTSLRIGDFVAVELSVPQELASGAESTMKGIWNDSTLYEKKLIF